MFESYADVETLLVDAGASLTEAQEIVAALSRHLSARQAKRWLSHPRHAHSIVDPAASRKFGVELAWTPVNAIASGHVDLVLEAARNV